MFAYDFDKTIYDGDTTVDFYLHAMRKHPSLILSILQNMLNVLLFACKRTDLCEFKSPFFQLLVPRVDAMADVQTFRKSKSHRIKVVPRVMLAR